MSATNSFMSGATQCAAMPDGATDGPTPSPLGAIGPGPGARASRATMGRRAGRSREEDAVAVVEVEDLRKSYDSFEAVKGVSFSLDEGEVLAVLGPNGA